MVAKIVSGKNMRGALNYNEQKVAQGKAECILANLFQKDLGRLTFRDKLERFNKLHERNQRTHTNTVHISLNFDRTDKLSIKDLQEVAIAYMDKIGFGEQPFLVYEHRDAAHPHVHVLTTLIQANGKRIPIHNLGRNQSEEARKSVEKEFGLVEASSKAKADYIRPVEVEKVIYGKSETRRSIASVVRSVTTSYRYTSLAELNAVLGIYNVRAERGHENSRMYERKGLLYSIVDRKGNGIGVPVKASALYGKPTLTFLEKQFKLNEVLRSAHRISVKDIIDQALTKGITTKAEFTSALGDAGITSVFRENSDGRTYGLTFVDHQHKVVFKGSDLGKGYSATAIMDKLQRNAAMPSSGARYIPIPSTRKDNVSDTQKGIKQLIADILSSEALDKSSPEAALRLNRKRRRRKGRKL